MIYERIEAALKDAIVFHNEGLSANDALTKSASQHELNPETICRVVEAFNIAKSRAYVKTASVKDADFDIGDKAKIIEAVFEDSTPKTAMSKVATEETESPFFEMKKTAVDLLVQKKEYFKDININENIIRAKKAQASVDAEMADLRGDIVFVKESFIKELQKAAEFFSYTHNADNSDALLDAASYQYLGNKTAGDVINLISKVANLEYELPQNPIPMEYGDSPIHEIIDGMVDDAEDYAVKVAAYNHEVDIKNLESSELNGLILKVAGISKDSATDLLFSGPKKTQSIKFEKFAEDLVQDISSDLFEEKKAGYTVEKVNASSFLKKADAISVPFGLGKINLGNIPLGQPLDSDSVNKTKELEEKGYISRLTQGRDSADKDYIDAEMQNVQRQAIVQDLMNNDEIISSYDPKITLSAYNTMLKLAPKASLMPDVVRSVLRYATAQTIDPNYASQLVELENNINKREAGSTTGGRK